MRELFIASVRSEFDKYIPAHQANSGSQLSFATGRFDEGAALLRYFMQSNMFRHERRVNVLDIGSGNGGTSFAFANSSSCTVHTLDLVPNVNLLAVRRVLPVPILPTVGDGSALPYKDGRFQVVLLLETLEHVAEPKNLACEIMRVLEPGGVCVVTTPARVRYILRRDPHYGVPGLVALPNSIQRFIVDDLLKRTIQTPSGYLGRAYDVTHLYWHVNEIATLFPLPRNIEVLYNRRYTPPGKFKLSWLRHPKLAIEQLHFNLREFFFDRILVWKPGRPHDEG
ncbi:MAG: class I SAM-dependent methyltransferase [Acidobacteriota bacterium]